MTRCSYRLVLILAALLFAGSAFGQAYPNRPVRIIVGFPPGTSLDQVGRPVGNELEKRLGQPFVMEFKPGANGTIGAKAVVTAKPDGYTLFYGNTVSIHPVLTRNNAVDAGKELLPISHYTTAPFFLVSRATLPQTTWQEVAAYAKANPNKLTYGATSQTIVLVMEMLKSKSGFNARGIPYKGPPPSVVALLADEIDIGTATVPSYLTQIQAGKLRPLFVASNTRSPLLPNVPSSAEVGVPGFVMENNVGLWAPLGTPKEIIDLLSKESAIVLRIPAMVEFIRKNVGAEPVGSTPEELLKMFNEESKFLAEAARLANYQPE